MNYLIGFPDEATALSLLAPLGYASGPSTRAKTRRVDIPVGEVSAEDVEEVTASAISAQLSSSWDYVTFTLPDGEEEVPGRLNGANAMPVSLVTGYEDKPDPMNEGATYRTPIFHPLYWVGLTTVGPDDALVTFCQDNGIPFAEIDPAGPTDREEGAPPPVLFDYVTRTSFPRANIDGILMVSPIWGGTSYPFPGDAG